MPNRLITYCLTILIICVGLLTSVPAPSLALAQDPPLVLAFYYAWYDQNTWSSGTTADQPAKPYTSSDRATVERHVAQAQAAGIDALIQSWYGPQETNNQTETNFRTLLDVAAARDFRAAVDFETTGPFFADRASVADALHTLLSVHAQHPAYLRCEGKPVVFFWREERFSVDEWAAIRAQVDPHHDSLWIAEGVDIAYQAVFDGHHLYSVAWSPDVGRTLSDWGFRVRRYEAQNGVNRLWVATVMPGYDDTHTDREDAFAVARRGGDYYRETWAAAVASQPDWIVITSFNEWVEGTMIESGQTYGDLYLDLTRELAMEFKAGGGGLEAEEQGSGGAGEQGGGRAGEQATLKSVSEEPYVRADEAARVRAGPGTDYPRLGRLEAGQTAPVVGKNSDSSWWQIKFTGSDGNLGWVSAEVVFFAGDAASVPVVSSVPPARTPTPTATRVPSPTATPLPTATRSPSPRAGAQLPRATSTTASPVVLPTAMPMPIPPPSATLSLEPSPSPTATFTPAPVGSPTATPMLRVAPVSQRLPTGFLWLGIGALLGALGLAGMLWRANRRRMG